VQLTEPSVSGMAYALHLRGLERLTLLSPSDPAFDGMAAPLLGRVTDLALRLKPFLVIVTNESQKTVVSFSKKWSVAHKGGRSTTFREHISFPEVVCGDTLVSRGQKGLLPGARRIEANGVLIHGWGDHDEYFDQFLPQFFDQNDRLLANATDLVFELTAAIFDDGTLIGPDDESWLHDTFSGIVEAKQQWYRGVLDALDAGRSVAEAFEPVDRFCAGWVRRLEAREPPHGDERLVWKRESAGDVQRWRRRFADDEIPGLLREAIRLEPFVIRRTA
jgi:hypothetical protein